MKAKKKLCHKHQILELPNPKQSRGWRWLVVGYFSFFCRQIDFDRDIYVFGVAGGNSIASIMQAFYLYELPKPRVWGFDSFSGIPDEIAGVTRPKGWVGGTYDSSVADSSKCRRTESGGMDCPKDTDRLSFKEQVVLLDKKLGTTRSNVNFIQGFYNESLSYSLYQSLPFKPALFVDIDCDLYISTFQALDWLFLNNIAVKGTLIGYDDWCLTDLGVAGESRAHAEISRKFKVKFRCILGGCTDKMLEPGIKSSYYKMVSSKLLNPIFLVESVGIENDSGMDVYPEKCKRQSQHWTQV